jgi:tetratricopeptide (TPR) repeat protein
VNVKRTTLAGVALVIFAGTMWLYWPSTQGGFLRVDDTEHLRHSAYWDGLTWNAVKWTFTSTEGYYQPLTQLSYFLDYQLWGRNAAGHHATGVFLHALNAALVFGFLWTLLGATPLATGERLMVAMWVAVVFAIHPLQTESVSWIGVRTQLLCTTFGISSLWAYVAGARRRVVCGLYVAALLCKPTAVSLPFIMLAIDYYPLRRHERFGWARLVREKAALIGVAGVFAIATVITVSRGSDPTASSVVLPLSERTFHMFEGLTFYLLKLQSPYRLSPYYFLDVPPAPWMVLAAVLTLVVVIVTAALVMERRWVPILVSALGAYVVLVLPTCIPIPDDRRVVAMRYAYEAILPLLVLIGAAVVWMWRRSTPRVRGVVVGLMACQLCALAGVTRCLIPDWHSDETMRRATLAEFPDSEEANRDLAMELDDQGKAAEALHYAQRGVELAPGACEAHVTLARVLRHLDRFPEAIEQHRQALQINPRSAGANYDFGLTLMDLGRLPEAAEYYGRALRINPHMSEAHCNLAITLVRAGLVGEAIGQFEQAVLIKPDDAELQTDLGNALAQAGRPKEAIPHYEQALSINPNLAAAHYNLGNVFFREGKVVDAIEHYQQALRITPNDTLARYNLERALRRMGPMSESAWHYEQTPKLQADAAPARNEVVCLQGSQ